MSGRVAVIHHEAYEGRGFAPMATAWRRYGALVELVREVGLTEQGVELIRPEPATEEELLLVHPPSFLDHVKTAEARGTGYVDYGDTPAYPGIYRRARISVGGSLTGARLIAQGKSTHAFNPGGGLHHARRDRAGGFCVFNDIVIAVRALQGEFGYERIAIVDIDGHHGDGTQALLYDEPLLTISIHQYDGRFYPGTGRADEVGQSAGYGYTINVPLSWRVGDGSYLRIFEEIVEPALRWYQPEFLLLQFGVDGHYQDPLVSLRLTTAAYEEIARRMHNLAHELCAGRLLIFGGGGYNPANAARCWTVMLAAIVSDVGTCQALADSEQPSEDPTASAQVDLVIQEVRSLVQSFHGILERTATR